MNQLQLYINDQLVDLNDDSPIALTFQINNLAEVQNQQGNTSNQFKLPLTQRNRRILGFPDDIAFTTNAPYQQYQAKLIQDGLEILPYGIAELNGIEQDNANITVLSGNVDFFDAIDGKLYDMGDKTTIVGEASVWKPYDHVWNLTNVINSQSKTDGWIYPVIDYGFISGNNFTSPIDVHYLRPGFFIKTAIDLLLKSAGYKGKGFLLDDPLYPLLICQFSNDSWEHGTNYQNQLDNKGLSVAKGMDQSFLHNVNETNKGFITFNTIVADHSFQYDGNTTFTAAEDDTVDITVIIPKFFFYGRPDTNVPSGIILAIYLNDSSISDTTYDFTDGYDAKDLDIDFLRLVHKTYNSRTLSTSIDLAQGDKISIRYEFVGAQPASFTLYKGATFTIATQNQLVKFGQTIQCERIFPDISQKDFLKDTLQRFGIICQTDNASKTISFNSLRDIINNIPIAKDWSAKVLDQGKQVSFQLGNYAQLNYMKYKEDNNVLPKDFANAQINVADTTLAATADLFESQFSPTLNRPYITGTIALIKMIDNTSDSNDFSIGVSPRIMIDQKLELPSGKTVTFTDGTNTPVTINKTISTPYFYKPDGEYNLCFCDMPGMGQATLPGLKTRYYPELQKVLTQTKKVVRYLMLNPRDILELDLLIPVYLQQDSAYYYINKIDSWRKGQPCKVELVKLG